MRIKLKVDISGTRDGVPWPGRGSVVELPNDEAQALIANGLAERVTPAPRVETATPPAPEVSTPVDSEPETATAPKPETATPTEPEPEPEPEPESEAAEPTKTPAKRGRPRKTST